MAIHTLAAAAHRVVHDIGELQGKGSVLFNTKQLASFGIDPQAYKKAIKAAETFFKHAQNDPHETLTFYAGQTEVMFVSAIECYRRLVHEKSRLMTLFLHWFDLHYPANISKHSTQIPSEDLAVLQELKRPAFFEVFVRRNLSG